MAMLMLLHNCHILILISCLLQRELFLIENLDKKYMQKRFEYCNRLLNFILVQHEHIGVSMILYIISNTNWEELDSMCLHVGTVLKLVSWSTRRKECWRMQHKFAFDTFYFNKQDNKLAFTLISGFLN